MEISLTDENRVWEISQWEWVRYRCYEQISCAKLCHEPEQMMDR